MHAEHVYHARCLWPSSQLSIGENPYAFGISVEDAQSEGPGTSSTSPRMPDDPDDPDGRGEEGEQRGHDEGEESADSVGNADDITILAYRPNFRGFLVRHVPFNLPRIDMEAAIRAGLMRAWDEVMPIPHDGFAWVSVVPQPNRYGDQIHTIAFNDAWLQGGTILKEQNLLIKHLVLQLPILQTRAQVLRVLDGELEERAEYSPDVVLECQGRSWPSEELGQRRLDNGALIVVHMSRGRSPSRSRSPHHRDVACGVSIDATVPPPDPGPEAERYRSGSQRLSIEPRSLQIKGVSSLGQQLRTLWSFAVPNTWPEQLPCADCASSVMTGAQPNARGSELWIFTDGSSRWDQQTGQKLAGFGCVAVGMAQDPSLYSIVAFLAGPVTCDPSSATWKGAGQATSGVAEVEALVWAALWCIQWSGSIEAQAIQRVYVVSDYAAGVFGAAGNWNWPKIPLADNWARYLWKVVEQCFSVSYLWTKGHAGFGWNEAADALAGMAAVEQTFNFVPEGPILAQHADVLQWAWMDQAFLASSVSLPCFKDDLMEFTALDQTRSRLGQRGEEPQSDTSGGSELLSFDFTAVTLNVQTLHTKKMGQGLSGRAQAILKQCEMRGWAVVGVQEFRRKTSGAFRAGTYHVYHAAGVAGQAGVELWINVQVPLGHVDGKPFFFNPDLATVAYSDHRLLMVKIQLRTFKLALGVAYAPHSHRPEVERDKFWADCRLKWSSIRRQGYEMICMMYANARLGSVESTAVGGFAAEAENANGAELHTLVLDLGMAIPATFHRHQRARDHPHCAGTWYSKGSWWRLDYVLASNIWLDDRSANVQTFVDFDFDMLQLHPDHRPAGVRFQLWTETLPALDKSLRFVNPLDREKLRRPEAASVLQRTLDQILEVAQGVPWHASSERHLTALTDAAAGHLCQHFAKKPRKAQPIWLSDEAWRLLQQQRTRRQQLRRVKSMHRCSLLRAIFLAWRDDRDEDESCKRWLVDCQHSIAAHTYALQVGVRGLRTALERDRIAELQRMAERQGEELRHGDARRMWAAVRRIVPSMRKTLGGSAWTFDKVAEQCRSHFASIEDGEEVDLEILADLVHHGNDWAQLVVAGRQVDALAMPTIFELEKAVRRIQCGKAYDISDFPPELARAEPRKFATVLWPLFLKSWVWMADTLAFKGGRVMPLYKGSGGRDSIDSFRSICVTSVVTRCCQAVLREKIMAGIRPHLPDLQIGGLPGMGTDYASQALRAQMALAVASKASFAVIFIDLAQAFYTTSRMSFCGDPLDLLSEEDWDAVPLAELGHRPAVQQFGLSPDVQHAAQQALHNSWFYVQRRGQLPDRTVVRSRRGTRPGTPTADIAFTAVMAKVLCSLNRDLEEVLAVPNRPTVPPIVWMDDLAILVQCKDPGLLMDKVSCAMGAVHHRMREHGWSINYKKGKTEVLLRLAGSGAEKWRRKLHHEDGNQFQLQSEQILHITSRYKHLGTFVDARVSMETEIKHRLAQAAAAWRSAAKRIFSNIKVPLQTRLQLYRSLVLSKLLWDVAGLGSRSAQEVECLCLEMLQRFGRSAAYRLE